MAKPKGPTLVCAAEGCGKSFHVPPVRAKTAKYCSQKCHYGDREAATRITKNCRQCGKEFQTWRAQDNDFCSYACSHKSQSNKERRICAYCGEPFEIKRTLVDLCCSWKCRIARQRNEVWAPKRAKNLRQCEECGKEFWVRPSQVIRYGGKYCSRRCMGLDFRSELPPPVPGFYMSAHWRDIRKQVLDRDGNACVQCGFDGKGLHAHHIVEKRNGGDEDLNNLVTLCNPCHQRTHRPKKQK